MSSRLSIKSLLYVTPLAAACVLTTGCANMVNSASSSPLVSANSAMTGQIHGGNQPVSNSDVRLFSVGTTGYGSAGIQYASTTTDVNGNFSFNKVTGAGTTGTATYGCPTNGTDPQMYLSAKGGNTQGSGNGSNSAAAFIIAIGKCSSINASTVVTMNELTTTATLAALQQYFSPANANSDNLPHFGTPASTQAQAGYANGLAILANLVNVSTGTNAANTITANGMTVTATPETAKLNTIANIGAACVNTTSSSSSACTTLFQNATPPAASNTSQPTNSFGTATTTVGAIWNMLTNPTSGGATNLNNLFNLTSAQAPFQPMEATAPTDWTVGLRYSSTSACASGANFLTYAYHLATDASGNLWAISNATGGNLFELSPAGSPLTCTGGTNTGAGFGMAIDIAGNVWTGGSANTNLYKYNPTSGATTTWPTGETTGTQFITSDASGNINFSSVAGGSIYQFPNGANTAIPPAAATVISSTVGTAPFFLGVDTVKNIFVSNSSTTTTLFDVYPSTAAGATAGYNTNNVGTTASTTNTYGVQAGLSGTFATVNGNYAASSASNTLSIYTPTTSGTATVNSTSAQYAGGIAGPRELAIDGAGNIWVANSTKAAGVYTTGATTGGQYQVSEFTATGTALSPTGSSTSTTTINGGFQKDATVAPVAFRGITVDPTGNVWLGSNASTGTGVTILVGAAVPVVTPIPAALAAGATTTNAVSKP